MNRRDFINSALLGAFLSPFILKQSMANQKPIHLRKIPSTGELIPCIGMGTWISFNVGNNKRLRDSRTQVLDTFFKMGGKMVDSSPMYGSAQEVMGYALDKLDYPKSLFSATKVWTSGKSDGIDQVKSAKELWGVKTFDLMQIHNLVAWEDHIETLNKMKEDGTIRYLGITTSHETRHYEMEKIMKNHKLDFVQFTYNIFDREVERRLLPLAYDKGIATIINRPFQGGLLFDKLQRYPLPSWKDEFAIENWAQFFLKFIISHPYVTCAIPSTSKVEHMKENMGALYTKLPDQKDRKKMLEYIRSL